LLFLIIILLLMRQQIESQAWAQARSKYCNWKAEGDINIEGCPKRSANKWSFMHGRNTWSALYFDAQYSCNDVALACIRAIMRDWKTIAKNECGSKNLYPSNEQIKTCNWNKCHTPSVSLISTKVYSEVYHLYSYPIWQQCIH